MCGASASCEYGNGGRVCSMIVLSMLVVMAWQAADCRQLRRPFDDCHISTRKRSACNCSVEHFSDQLIHGDPCAAVGQHRLQSLTLRKLPDGLHQIGRASCRESV